MAMAEGQLLDYLETGVALPENELERWLASLPLAQADRTRLTRLLASAPAAADRFDLANYCLQIVARVGPGDMVGRFRLEREIGRGGMARVFHARRVAGDFDQDVAIKFVDAGIVAPQVKSLFERERQILAGLRHPNIASLYDGGEHDGLAYIVMEYVEGKAIDAYCRQHASTARDVVRLFVQLCAGVQAAHNALVVHGDIKPSNVLVTEAGLPKLLDFGIARLAERDNSIDSQTFGGTLTYAAPEQIRREQLATAADVFSLGVLLIELLDGARAWPGLAPEATAAQRLTHYRTARPHSDALSGELAAIARKASAFAPDQRYASAGALSEDLVRFLRGYPVVAMPQDRGYFLRCFVRRNRLPVVLAGGVLLSLVLGLTLTTWQFLRADREREQAQQTLGVLKDVILSPSRWSKLTTGNDLLLSTQSTIPQLWTALELHTEHKAIDPAIRADLLKTLADSNLNLDRWDEAVRLADKALDLMPDTRSPLALQTRAVKAFALQKRGDPDAIAAYRDLFEAIPGTALDGQPWHADLLQSYAVWLWTRGDLEAAADRLGEALAMLDPTPPSQGRVFIQGNLALLNCQRGRLSECIGDLRSAIAAWHTLGNPPLASFHRALASAYLLDRNLEAAFAEAETAVQAAQSLYPGTLEHFRALIELIGVETERSNLIAAKQHLDEASRLADTLFDAQHPEYVSLLLQRARLLQAQGLAAQALAVLEARQQLVRPDAPYTLLTTTVDHLWAKVLLDLGRTAAAGQHLEKALELRRKLLGEDAAATRLLQDLMP